MKYILCLLLLACSSTHPLPVPTPQPIPLPIPKPQPVPIPKPPVTVDRDTVYKYLTVARDTTAFAGSVSVKSFGAMGNFTHDDGPAILAACNYCIANPWACTTVRFPIGNYRTTRPILLQNNGNFFTIRLLGAAPAKSASEQYLSKITYDSTAGFAVGIQLGRGVVIENLSIQGRYTFPYTVTNKNIATLRFADWDDGSVTDSRNNPYAGISIDPYPNVSGSGGGTSDIEIKQCAIKQFMVGVCLTPNAYTSNDEMINIVDDDIEAVRVAIAIGQDQSKTISITNLKCWASTHTVLDGITYGRGTGGGSVFCENWNIAGNVNQLFNLNADRFTFSCKDIYSESLFRIGTVSGTFFNASLDFLSGPGMPAPDYIINGSGVFFGGMLRYYDNSTTHRMNFSGHRGMVFYGTVLNMRPILGGLYGDASSYPKSVFDNVGYYYNAKKDTLIQFPTRVAMAVDTAKWTASFDAGTMVGMFQGGDYVVGSGQAGQRYYDTQMNVYECPLLQYGRVVSIVGTVVNLDNAGLNTYLTGNDNLYIERLY